MEHRGGINPIASSRRIDNDVPGYLSIQYLSLARENRAKQRARGWISRERKERKPCFNTGVSTERKHFTVRMIRNLLKRWLKLPVQHVIKAKLIQYPINPEFTFKREGGTRYFPIKSVIALGFKISRRSSCWLHNETKVWSRNDCTVSGRDRGSFWFSDRIGNFQCNWIDSSTTVFENGDYIYIIRVARGRNEKYPLNFVSFMKYKYSLLFMRMN